MKKFRNRLLLLLLVGGLFYTAASCSVLDKKGSKTNPTVIIATQGSLKFNAGPLSLPKGSQIAVIDGNPAEPGMFTLRLKFPKNYTIPPHQHPVIEHVTVISGSLYLAMGDTLNRDVAKRVPRGGVIIIPAKNNHFAYTKK